ncbi:MAG: hypothetical protein WBF90_35180 [Rivularia sp. (in: cyanobacteria)]|jgi:hypothetical protein
MTEPFLLILFKVIWLDLIDNIAYDSTKQNWQALQIVIEEIKNNQQVNQNLAIALEKSFYYSDKYIAEKCREELIKNSTFTQYRGAKIYKPAENDTAIKNLESKIKSQDKQLKRFGRKIFAKNSVFEICYLEKFLKQLSQSNYETSEAVKSNANKQLLEAVEKDWYGNIYKAAIRNKENGLRKSMFQNFLIEIEPNEQLNRIFHARTYIILNKIRQKA